uniref:Uncharacterized protein n=1 Tax=Quercus lobata TaxID=97700 RepID=A0A7N2MEJ9_QUELO
MVDSFHNISESIENLSSAYLKPYAKKETILNPKVHISDGTAGGGVPRLLPNIDHPHPLNSTGVLIPTETAVNMWLTISA